MKKYTFSTVIWGGEGGLSCQFFSIKKTRNVQKLSYSLQHILYFWNPIGMSLTGFIFFFVVTNCWDCNITTELFLLHLYLKLHLKCFTGFCIRLWFRFINDCLFTILRLSTIFLIWFEKHSKWPREIIAAYENLPEVYRSLTNKQ